MQSYSILLCFNLYFNDVYESYSCCFMELKFIATAEKYYIVCAYWMFSVILLLMVFGLFPMEDFPDHASMNTLLHIFFVHRCKYLHLLYPWGWNCCIIRLANVRLEWLISNCFPERLDWRLPHQESMSFHRSAASPALCAISLFNCRHSVRVCSGVSFWF